MKRAMMLAVVLLLSAAWLQAQQDPQSGSTKAGSQSSSSQMGSGSETTVEGCLQGSSGNFTLTDKAGTTYQLAGDTSKLTEHVGHEVEIKGTTSAPGSSAGSSAASTGSAPSGSQTLTVVKVKHMSKTCSSAK